MKKADKRPIADLRPDFLREVRGGWSYLSPNTYVEEVDRGAKPIEAMADGVGTSPS